MSSPAAPFDQLAHAYHSLWSGTDIGRLQREAFRRLTFSLFRSGERLLDLGCGTGDDAVHLASHGCNVVGIDASAEMVRIAGERGVDARVCCIEDIACVGETFDGAISNFGALNCVANLSEVRDSVARAVLPGGYFAVCVMGRLCLWETVWYLLRGEFGKAMRRWKGHTRSSLGLEIFYPTLTEITRAFAPAFRLVRTAGIGIFVPPSFVYGLSGALLERLDGLDRRVAGNKLFTAISDHRLLIFRRA